MASFLVVNFWIKVVTMATSYLMTGKHIPQFGLANLLNIYTFLRWNFFILCHIMEIILPNIWIGKTSRLFRRIFQYSVICHFSKYIRLALTDFHKNKVFYRKCVWLQLRQVLKEFTEENARKYTVSFAFSAHVDVIKIEKHWCFPLSALSLITWAFVISARAMVKL